MKLNNTDDEDKIVEIPSPNGTVTPKEIEEEKISLRFDKSRKCSRCCVITIIILVVLFLAAIGLAVILGKLVKDLADERWSDEHEELVVEKEEEKTSSWYTTSTTSRTSPTTTTTVTTTTEKPTTTTTEAPKMKEMIDRYKTQFSTIDHLSTEKIKRDSDAIPRLFLFLDVRTIAEFNVSHIGNSVFLDFDQGWEKGLPFVTSALRRSGYNKLIVVCYCALGYRASTFATKFQDYMEVNRPYEWRNSTIEFVNMAGGLFRWANERKPMVDKAGQPTQFCHPYNKHWGRLLHRSLHKYTSD